MSASRSRTDARPRPYAAAYLTAALGGAAIGTALALPIPDVSASCPPPEKGLVLCTIQKAWLPAIAKLVLCAAAMMVVVRLLVSPLTTSPLPRAEVAQAEVEPTPPFACDPYLLVATWGNTYEVERHRNRRQRHHWRDRHGRELHLREPQPHYDQRPSRPRAGSRGVVR